MSAPIAPEDFPFIDYVNAIEDELEGVYGLSIFDAGIELEQLAHAQEAGQGPTEWVNWFGQKYDLTRKEEVWLI